MRERASPPARIPWPTNARACAGRAYSPHRSLSAALAIDPCASPAELSAASAQAAKGFVFLSLEDETGIANIILTPDIFEQNRLIVTRSRFLAIVGKLQNQEGVIHVMAERIEPLLCAFNPR